MKFTTAIALLIGAAATVSATPNPIPGVELETRTNTYVGTSRSLFARAGLEARCHGGNLWVGSDCTPGKCQCTGQAGCYSCNGKTPACQATDSNGNPTTCY